MKKKNYCKNGSDNDHTLSLNFFKILNTGSKGLRGESYVKIAVLLCGISP